jgi:hypothetical protein
METAGELSQEAAINQSNNINDPASEFLPVFIVHAPGVFTALVPRGLPCVNSYRVPEFYFSRINLLASLIMSTEIVGSNPT